MKVQDLQVDRKAVITSMYMDLIFDVREMFFLSHVY